MINIEPTIPPAMPTFFSIESLDPQCTIHWHSGKVYHSFEEAVLEWRRLTAKAEAMTHARLPRGYRIVAVLAESYIDPTKS